MGLLDFFSKPKAAAALERMPSGSFTVDRSGKILASTLPHTFSEARVLELGKLALDTFQRAREAKLPLTELHVHFTGLKLTIREQRGGAMIFLAPVR